MKHLDKALIGAGAALLLSGGMAAAALGPTAGTTFVASLPGDLTLAVNGHGIGGPGFLAAAATYIGITEDQLRTALASGKSLADVAVANGKTRDGLIAALVVAATTDITTLVDKQEPFPAKGPGGLGFPGGPRVEGDSLAAAVTYLGTTTEDLRTKMQAGQTLAQIANATAGKSRDGLIAALVAASTAKIDAAQAAGTITADQATKAKANLTQRITDLVDSNRPLGGFGSGRGHRP